MNGMATRIEADPESGCWLWTGSRTGAGYGDLKRGGVHMYAHRAMYELHVGPIPPELTVDHLCRVRHCVNPEHMELVTSAENTRRATAVKTACVNGHPYDLQNTHLTPRGHRRCRACARERMALRRDPSPEPMDRKTR